MNDIMYRAEQQGFSITDVDALTGRSIGRPKMGTYGLSDLVGLDIAMAVIKGLQKIPEEQPFFKDVTLSEKLAENDIKWPLGDIWSQLLTSNHQNNYLIGFIDLKNI